MRKIIVLVLGIGLIAGLAYYATTLKQEAKATDTSLIAFAIEDTASVDKIEIYDSFLDISYTLSRKKGGRWVGEDGECVQQSIVEMMLETMHKVTLRGYVPESAMENMKKLLMAQHKEVKIYQKGKWVKTWYVGHSTRDHMGTHMLLETPKMKSDNPVIMGMKGFYGILEPRFFADKRQFACTDLFSFKRNEIKSVEVISRINPEDSYSIRVNGPDDYLATGNDGPIAIDKDNLVFYLNSFENIHFNQPNYTMSKRQIDSLNNAQADYELTIEAENDSYHMKMYRRLDPEYNPRDTIAYDMDYLWAIPQDGDLVRMQYHTVSPLIQGRVVFEVD